MEPLLLIEDETLIRRAYRRILELNGFAVLEASDGNEGVKMLQNSGFEVSAVILDINMPQYDGDWFFTQLNEELVRRRIPVIVLSGHIAEDDRFPKACQRVLSKPVSTATLLETIRQLSSVGSK